MGGSLTTIVRRIRKVAGGVILGRKTSGVGPAEELSPSDARTVIDCPSNADLTSGLAGKANSSHTHAQSDVTGLVSALAAKADLVGGLVPSSQLPSYVDDVIEGTNLAAFPGTGETGKIYVALDTGKTYRWSGSAYVELTDATAVWGSISGTLSHQTDLQAALTARAVTTTTITAGTGLSGGGDLSANRSLAVVYGTTSGTSCQGNDSRLSDARTPTAHTHPQSDVTGLVSALASKADLVGGLVPASQLPSYVDDVIEGTNLAAFPGTGETGKIYVALDTGKTYRWSGSAYVELTDATAVWGSISGTLSNQTDLQSALMARALTTTTMTAGTGLSGGGDLSANRTLSLSDTTVTAGSYTSANITVDAQGRITAAANGSGGGGSPGGSSGQLQFNNAGAFGGTTAIVYSGTGTHVVVTAQSATTVPVCFKGAASQSANLTEWQNSSGTVLVRVDPSGYIYSASGGRYGFNASNYISFASFGLCTIASGGDLQFSGNSNSSGIWSGANQGGTMLIGVSSRLFGKAGLGTNGVGRPVTIDVGAGTGSATPALLTLRTTTAGASGTTVQTYRDSLQLDGNTTSGETPMLILDLEKGTLQRVSIGASDSGGTGFKVLRVPN